MWRENLSRRQNTSSFAAFWLENFVFLSFCFRDVLRLPPITRRSIFNHGALKNTIRCRGGTGSGCSHAGGDFVSKLITGVETWFSSAPACIMMLVVSVNRAIRTPLRMFRTWITVWRRCSVSHVRFIISARYRRSAFSWCSCTLGNSVFWDNIKRRNTLIYYLKPSRVSSRNVSTWNHKTHSWRREMFSSSLLWKESAP